MLEIYVQVGMAAFLCGWLFELHLIGKVACHSLFITYKLDAVFHLRSGNALTGATDAIIGYFISFLCCNTGKILKKRRKYIVVLFFFFLK